MASVTVIFSRGLMTACSKNVLGVRFRTVGLQTPNNVNIYSEREYKNILEHTDIRIDGAKFNILHYMLDNNSKLIISETFSGIVVRTSLHGYVLIPFHKYKTSNTGTLQSIGNVFSLCAYHSNDNNIVFF